MDPVAAAIDATERAQAEPRTSLTVRLQSGRFVAFNLPLDLTEGEAIALVGYIATQLPVELAKLRQPGPHQPASALAVARS